MDNEQFEGAMNRIKDVTDTRTQVELAEFIGVRQSSISDAKRRCSIPSDWLIVLLDKLNINPAWVINSEAEPKYRILSDENGEPLNVEELREQIRAEIKAQEDNPHAEDLIHRLEAMDLHVTVSPARAAA